MVVFTCNHCGDSLQKPRVEKHYQFQCRNYKSLTCVDCLKDFRDEEYDVHTKCVTEDERYAAKGTYKNGIVKKGEAKQDSWMEMIKSICATEPNLKPSLKTLLETISNYNNVPRKKIKFLNFIKSSSGNRANMKEVEEVWDIIEKYKTKSAPERNQNVATKRPNDEVNEEAPKKVKLDAEESGKFDYNQKVLEILRKKHSLSLTKLQKKILKAYGEVENEEKIIKKLGKKLKKMPNITLEDDKVSLNVE